MTKFLTVIGNRPQFVKAAAVSHRLRAVADEVLVHTGQHYDDDALAGLLRASSALPRARAPARPRRRHEHRARRRACSRRSSRCCASERPDAVLVYGDTNSTLAGALAAAQAQIPVAHVEAGMRSFDRAMPEELNRVLTDHASTLLLCSSEAPAANLRAERVAGADRGGRRRDGRHRACCSARAPPSAPRSLEAYGRRAAASSCSSTAHRAGNVDDPARLERLVALLEGAARRRSSARCTRARARGWRPPACSTRLRAPGVRSSRRSATSSSPRCCSTRARC